jgi:hypothetical protein
MSLKYRGGEQFIERSNNLITYQGFTFLSVTFSITAVVSSNFLLE